VVVVVLVWLLFLLNNVGYCVVVVGVVVGRVVVIGGVVLCVFVAVDR